MQKTKFKPEDKTLLKRKMVAQAGYKKHSALLDDSGKETLIEIIQNGAICELKEKQVVEGGYTLTIKFYFNEIDG